MTWAIEKKDHSQRRACLLVGMAAKTCRCASWRPDDGQVRVRLRALANERRRFAYRRLHILLAREGDRLNHKKLFRLYRAERQDGGGPHGPPKDPASLAPPPPSGTLASSLLEGAVPAPKLR